MERKTVSEEEKYASLVDRIAACGMCGLAKGRDKTVPGDGARDADIMFIGEAPGFYEDRQGLPFVGRAGGLLNEMLASINLRRSDVFITNMVKCRPPNNRDPFPAEISACAAVSRRADRDDSPEGYRGAGAILVLQVFPQ